MRVRPQKSLVVWLFPLLLVGAGVLAGWSYLGELGADPDRLWQEAQLDLQAHRLDRAEQTLARLSRVRPPTPADWMLRAQVAISRERSDEALGALARIPDRDPLAAQARAMAGQVEL